MRIVIAEDDPLLREGISAVLVAEGTIHVPQGEGRKGADDVAA